MGDVNEGTRARQVTVTVTGIEDYKGSINKDVAITETPRSLEGIAVNADAAKLTYTEGEKLDPKGLVLTLTYSNGTSEQVEYNDDTKNDFTFDPTLDTELTENGNLQVTVTYGGKSASYVVSVSKKANPDPDKPNPEPSPDPKPNPDQPKPEPSPDPKPNPGKPNPDKPGKNNASGSMPETGDNALVAVAATGCAGVAAIAWGMVARKRRQN